MAAGGEMFGAPIGISQSNSDQRENLLGGMQALKLMSEVEAQPAQTEYVKAQTEYARAHAKDTLAQAAAREETARRAGIMARYPGMTSPGTPRPGEAADAPSGVFGGMEGAQKAMSVFGAGPQLRSGKLPPVGTFSAQMFDMAQYALGNGLVNEYEKLQKEGTEIYQKEMLAQQEGSKSDLNNVETKQREVKLIASAAGGVYDDKSLARFKMELASMGRDSSFIPNTYGPEARAVLGEISRQGIDADKQLELARKKIVDEADLKLKAARVGALGKATKLTDLRTTVLQEDRDRVKKYDGEKSSASRDAKVALTESRRAGTETRMAAQAAREVAAVAKQVALYPRTPAPDRKYGKAYTAPDDSVGVWTKGAGPGGTDALVRVQASPRDQIAETRKRLRANARETDSSDEGEE